MSRKLVCALAAALCVAASVLADYSRMDFITCQVQNGTGTWVLTDYTPLSTDRIEMKLRSTNFTATQCLFCSRGLDAKKNSKDTITTFIVTGKTIRYDSGIAQVMSNSPYTLAQATDSSVDHVIAYDGNAKKGYVDGANEIAFKSSDSYTGGSKMALFAAHTAGSGLNVGSAMNSFAYFRFYYCRIYNKNGKLVRNFVPARDNSQNPESTAYYGVWDTVTEQFFPNRGGIAFDPTGATALGKLGAAVSPIRTAFVTGYGVSAGSNTMNLEFDNPGYAQHLYLAWNSMTAGGDTTNDWEHVEQLTDVLASEEARTVPLPAGSRYVRFFLKPILPNGLTMVDYLHSTGTDEYVDTGFTPTSASRADCHFTLANGKNVKFMSPFGSRKGNSLQFFVVSKVESNSWFRRYGSQLNDANFEGKPDWGGEHSFSLDHNQYTLDSHVNQMTRADFTCACPAYIFAVNDDGTAAYFADMKLHSFTLWDDGVLVRNYVPCLNASGAAALYETVTGQLVYGANGTTPLTAGGESLSKSSVYMVDMQIAMKAVWTGAGDGVSATDAANWNCTNVAGLPITGGFTEQVTDLYIEGNVALTFSGRIPHKSVVFGETTLAADVDLRGHGPVRVEGTVDLNGHRLYLEQLVGGGQITETHVFDLTTTETSKVSGSETIFHGDTVAANLFNNNFTSNGADDTRRVIVEKKNLPMVVDYNFGSPTTIDAYRVHAGPNNLPERGPKTWTLEGSNDGSSWTVVDARDNIFWGSDSNGWIFSLEQPATYSRFRFKVTDSNDADNGYMEFVQLEYGCQRNLGELHVEVPENELVQNNDVTIDGQVRFFKDGKGTLVMAKPRQFFWSTTVTEGLLKLVVSSEVCLIGRAGAEITIEADGAIDLAGAVTSDICKCSFNLNGGTLKNTVSVGNNVNQMIQNVHLGADSTVEFKGYGFFSSNKTPTLLDLNGHTLTANGVSGNNYMVTTYATPGKVRLMGTWEIVGPSYPLIAPDTQFEVYGNIKVNSATTFGDYLDYSTVTTTDCNAVLTVARRFMPNTDYFRGCTLQDGAVLDLSGRTNVFNLQSKLSGTTMTNVIFSTDGKYTIDLSGRSITNGEQLVSWNNGLAPSDYGTLSFTLDNATRKAGYRLEKLGTGIFIVRDNTVIFLR